MPTEHTEMIEGYPIMVPNKVINADGFYISYNDYDIRTYGCDTTALVLENPTHFYILNNDHRENYKPLMDDVEKCLEYFKQHVDQINEMSEKLG